MAAAASSSDRRVGGEAKAATNTSRIGEQAASPASDDASSKTSGSTDSKPSRRGSNAAAQRPAKRAQVRHACYQCRNTKLRCSGNHPICTRCLDRGLECEYEVPSNGITRMQHLRNQVTASNQELESVTALIDLMRYGTDQQAAEALARFRTGDSIELVLQQDFAVDFRNQPLAVEETSGSQQQQQQQQQQAYEGSQAPWHRLEARHVAMGGHVWDPAQYPPVRH